MKHKLRNAIILTSVCVGSLHIINQFISSAATVKNLLPIRPGKYFDWRHGRVYYRKFGSGKPLLLIHDLDPSSSAYEWNQLEQQLAKDFFNEECMIKKGKKTFHKVVLG